MPTFPYLRIHFLNTRYAFSMPCSPLKVLRNLAAADELPNIFSFEFVRRTQERRTVFGLRKDCLERCQSSDDVTSTFVGLVHWMDETLV